MEVWIVTWFCLAMSDPICARLEGATGNMTFDSSEMCRLMVAWGVPMMRKLDVPLAGVCWKVGDVYQPLQRPRRLR
jgi:hypothetical protein